MRAALRAYQPIRPVRITPSHPLRAAARQAFRDRDRRPRGGHQGFEGDGHRSTRPAGLDKVRELGPLALVLATPRPRGAAAPPGPDDGGGEVIEPRAAA